MKTQCVEKEREMIRRGEEVLEVGKEVGYIYLSWISMPLICCLYIYFD